MFQARNVSGSETAIIAAARCRRARHKGGKPVYLLEVYLPHESGPHHTERIRVASDALARIPALLHEHDGCERIVVYFGATRLFAVDCKGNTLPR
jgi:hypothetical protein